MTLEDFLENNSQLIESGSLDEIVSEMVVKSNFTDYLPSFYLLPIIVYRGFPLEFRYNPPNQSMLIAPNSAGPVIFSRIVGVSDNPKEILRDYLIRKKFKTKLIDKLLNQVKVVEE